jgi:hypothetical protein
VRTSVSGKPVREREQPARGAGETAPRDAGGRNTAHTGHDGVLVRVESGAAG